LGCGSGAIVGIAGDRLPFAMARSFKTKRARRHQASNESYALFSAKARAATPVVNRRLTVYIPA
jgi:hypothetical protein